MTCRKFPGVIFCIKRSGRRPSSASAPLRSAAQRTASGRGEQEEIAELAAGYIAEFGAPGVSFAVGRHGRLIYAEGFGIADPATDSKVAPPNLFRIASISKPMTAVTVFTLIEQGKLTLADKMLGRRYAANEYGVRRTSASRASPCSTC